MVSLGLGATLQGQRSDAASAHLGGRGGAPRVVCLRGTQGSLPFLHEVGEGSSSCWGFFLALFFSP